MTFNKTKLRGKRLDSCDPNTPKQAKCVANPADPVFYIHKNAASAGGAAHALENIGEKRQPSLNAKILGKCRMMESVLTNSELVFVVGSIVCATAIAGTTFEDTSSKNPLLLKSLGSALSPRAVQAAPVDEIVSFSPVSRSATRKAFLMRVAADVETQNLRRRAAFDLYPK